MRQHLVLFISLGLATTVAALAQYVMANNVSTYRVTVTQEGHVVDEAVIQVRPEDKVGLKSLTHQPYTQSSSVTLNRAGVIVDRQDTQAWTESGLSVSISRSKSQAAMLDVSYATLVSLQHFTAEDGAAIDLPSQDISRRQVPLDLAVNHSRQWVINPTLGFFPSVPNPHPLTLTVTRLDKESLAAL